MSPTRQRQHTAQPCKESPAVPQCYKITSKVNTCPSWFPVPVASDGTCKPVIKTTRHLNQCLRPENKQKDFKKKCNHAITSTWVSILKCILIGLGDQWVHFQTKQSYWETLCSGLVAHDKTSHTEHPNMVERILASKSMGPSWGALEHKNNKCITSASTLQGKGGKWL